MKRYLAIIPSPRNGAPDRDPHRPFGPDVFFGSTHETLKEAQKEAAQRAGIRNEPVYVLEILGFEGPQYDPVTGWRPWSKES